MEEPYGIRVLTSSSFIGVAIAGFQLARSVCIFMRVSIGQPAKVILYFACDLCLCFILACAGTFYYFCFLFSGFYFVFMVSGRVV